MYRQRIAVRFSFILIILMLSITLEISPSLAGESENEWIEKIRRDHPRLFFNQDMWPEIKERALNEEKEWYEELRQRVERYPDNPTTKSTREDYAYQQTDDEGYETVRVPRPTEWGRESMECAFAYLMSKDPALLEKTRHMLIASVKAYQDCYEKGMTVNWYSTSRVSALAAYDWIYNDLSEEERHAIIKPLLQHIDNTQPGPGKKRIYRLNGSDYTTGFYGERNLVWFAGLAAYNDGIDDERALRFLKTGYEYNQNLFEYRKKCAGDDGGLASATVGYAMGAYPWSQFNFLHTWKSATGEDIAGDWPHLAYFPVWVMWNWIPGDPPREYGSGDTYHYTNELRLHYMYSHMSQIMHFYGEEAPECAAQAAYLRSILPENMKRHRWTWPVYPFLLTDLDRAPQPDKPEDRDLHARHFETLGQVIMRSGTTEDDTFSMFTIGSRVPSHKQHDENSFIIYKNGYLALDSGTRGRETGYQLRHYYSQTVAHNSILIHMPGEPFPGYWGPKCPDPEGQISSGGTYRTTGGICKAFETNPYYTYVAGDATPCYREEKCSLALRQYVFIYPDYFVICDRLNATNADYKKDWLLHTQNEPTVINNMFYANENEGRLFCKTLYPQDAMLTKIGGPDKAFYACGRNWDVVPEVKARWGDEALWGNWRMEISPGEPRKEDVFLHLIQVADQSQSEMVESKLIESNGKIGVHFQADEQTNTVTFGLEGDPSGHIRIENEAGILIDKALSQKVMPQKGLAGKPMQ